MYKGKDYSYYETMIYTYEKKELLIKMVEMFDDIEIDDIYDDTVYDEDGYADYDVTIVRVKQDRMKYNGLSEVLIRGFDMNLVEA